MGKRVKVDGNISKSVIAGVYIMFTIVGLTSCGSENKDYIDTPFDRESMPTMAVDSVTELISDSGLIRYKLITQTWLFFENSKDPHWFFPNGLYVEQFDTAYNIEATLKADTVWNYTQRKLWRLKGNVFVRNSKDETFQGPELFWNEKTGKVYSDKFIEINRPGKLVLKGHGFESNQQMTQYTINRPYDGELYYNETDGAAKADSASLQVNQD